MRRAKTAAAAKKREAVENKRLQADIRKKKKEVAKKLEAWRNLPEDQWTEARKAHMNKITPSTETPDAQA